MTIFTLSLAITIVVAIFSGGFGSTDTLIIVNYLDEEIPLWKQLFTIYKILSAALTYHKKFKWFLFFYEIPNTYVSQL